MKIRFLTAVGLGLIIGAAPPGRATDLRQLMTQDEFVATGLGRLDASEVHALEQWVTRYVNQRRSDPVSSAQDTVGREQRSPDVSRNGSASRLEETIVTGTRIRRADSARLGSTVALDASEIALHQEAEIERILRRLPLLLPGDGSNVNNGSQGAATLDLRGLGPQRNLVLINGKRQVPYNFLGQVDTTIIPTALVERVEIVTGGASAVYGSDALAGAVNFLLKRDFEGVEFDSAYSETGKSDGAVRNVSLTLGSNFADGRGNSVLSLSWLDRDEVLQGERDLGKFSISTSTGANYEQFLHDENPLPPPAGCGGPNVLGAAGSTTSVPSRFAIVGVGTSARQFREDRSLGGQCNGFNFNPDNLYQTPLERYGATAISRFAISERSELYGRFNFTNSTVLRQVAPSGTFGATFELPLRNPFLSEQARGSIIEIANSALASGQLDSFNWDDVNANGLVDTDDYLLVQLPRRTVELGQRTERYESDQYQLVLGWEGAIFDDWHYDTFLSYGESNRTTVRKGYTNIANIQNALDTFDGITCNRGDPACVPIDLFGAFGTITPDMADYASAIALQRQKYEQTIVGANIEGPVSMLRLPTADEPLRVSLGVESREESASLIPDDCLQQAPAGCLGGGGGNLLPLSGRYSVDELYFESLLPLADDIALVRSLELEFGYRWSDYQRTGDEGSWKYGLRWRPSRQLAVHAMRQRANRSPNISELAAPQIAALSNAQSDPCSATNAANIDDRLRDLCQSTGMTSAQVGTVQDLVSGQVNTFRGSDPGNLPGAESADTLTLGLVWSPDFAALERFSLSVDYYDIDIDDVVGQFSAQEVLDDCYRGGMASECAKIRRIGGGLTVAGSGIELYTSNLDSLRAEGLEFGLELERSLGRFGQVRFTGLLNRFLTKEFRSSSSTPVIDCKGRFGTSCDPTPALSWTQRATWSWKRLTVSALWQHIGAVKIMPEERARVFPAFRKIDSADYVNLSANYQLLDALELRLNIDNVFDKDPPVVGNEAGDTNSNSGNTFPSTYDVLGRRYTIGVNMKF